MLLFSLGLSGKGEIKVFILSYRKADRQILAALEKSTVVCSLPERFATVAQKHPRDSLLFDRLQERKQEPDQIWFCLPEVWKCGQVFSVFKSCHRNRWVEAFLLSSWDVLQPVCVCPYQPVYTQSSCLKLSYVYTFIRHEILFSQTSPRWKRGENEEKTHTTLQ